MNEIEKEIKACPICDDVNKTGILRDWQNNVFTVCGGCGAWYQTKHTTIKYDSTYWGEVIDPDGIRRDLTTERNEKIGNWYGDTINYIDRLKPGKILDIGSGLGFFLSAVSGQWERHAFDVSEEALSFIKKSMPTVYRHSNLEDTIDDLGKEYFDVIMCYHVIEHLANPASLIESMNRLLKPGGLLILGAPNAESYVAKRFKGNFRLLGNAHLWIPTKKSMETLLKRQGLKIKNMEYPYFKTDYFTIKNLLRLRDRRKLSPPFYGSIMTAYIKKDES
jgi:2-polyprenyl-3-methyl-5-hydroxy-6-metoxy-1,4-benzoquinol methylase